MLRPGDTLGDIYFFTAFANFLDDGIVARHQCLLDALESYGIKIMHGYFEKTRKTKKLFLTRKKNQQKYQNMITWKL